MDRRYYGLKALLIALGVSVAIGLGHFASPRIANPMAASHYHAAVSVQMKALRSFTKLSNAFVRLLH